MGRWFRQYIWVIHILVILFCSYFLAKIVNVYLGKAMEIKKSIGVMKAREGAETALPLRSMEDYEVIVKRNIFDSADVGAPPCEGPDCPTGEAVETVVTGEAVKTSLPIKVRAVLVVGDGKDKRSSSTIEGGKDKGVNVYAVRGEDTFYPGVELVQVKPDRIEFVHNGRLEYAELDQGLGASIFGPPQQLAGAAVPAAPTDQKKGPETVTKLGEGKYVIDQREIDNALQNLDKLYTEIRAVPNFQDGKVTGLKIHSIKPGSVFQKLGLQRGDVLQKINGMELDVKNGFQVFGQLKDAKNLTLDFNRGGANQSVEYEIR